MRTNIFLSIIQCVTLIACSSTGSKSKTSEWVTARESKSMSCFPWPLGEKDLNVENVTPLTTRPFGFQAVVRQRNGGKKFYFTNYEAKEAIEYSALNARDFGAGAFAVGVAVLGKDIFVPVVKPSGNNNSILELRSLNTNVVLFQSSPLGIKPTEGRVVSSKQGIWLELTVTDAVKAIVFVSKSEGKFVVQKIERVNDSENSIFVQGDQKRIYEVKAPKETAPVDGKVQFNFSALDPESNRSDAQTIALPSTESIESWSASGGEKKLVLAYVDGDSLIGKGSLRISKFTSNSDLLEEKVSKELKLRDNHLSEPFALNAGSKEIVLISRWVDKESVLSVYRIASNSVEEVGTFGSLEIGARIANAFYDSEDQNLVVVFRAKHENFWDYQVCHIEVDL